MRDWKAIAKAGGSELGDKELDRLVQPLAALEEIFRPLADNLSPETEPAAEFRVEAGVE